MPPRQPDPRGKRAFRRPSPHLVVSPLPLELPGVVGVPLPVLQVDHRESAHQQLQLLQGSRKEHFAASLHEQDGKNSTINNDTQPVTTTRVGASCSFNEIFLPTASCL